MDKQVLVAYATKYGATAEIAGRIGEALQEMGLSTDVRPVQDVGDLGKYGAVVLGSAVYIGGWRKEATQFLEDRQEELAQLPVWLFSSGPTGEGDPEELLKGWSFPDKLKPIADRIQPRGIVVFHGAIDVDELNFMERFVIKNVKAPVGDFRDWDSIDAWAQTIAETLTA